MPIPLGILAAAGRSQAPAGAFQLLESTVLTGSQASVEFTNLTTKYAATYQHLQLRMVIRNDRSVGYTLGEARLRFNSVTGSGNYYTHWLHGNGSSVISQGYSLTAGMDVSIYPSAPAPANTFAATIVDILDPFETTKNKTVRSFSGVHTGGSSLGDDNVIGLYSGLFISTNAVSTIAMVADNSNFVQGSRFSLYGLRSV